MCSTFYGGSSSHTRWPSTSSLRFTSFASGPGTGVFVSFTTSSVRTNTHNHLGHSATVLWTVGFIACTALVLIPSPLIEPRYFLIPTILLRLQFPRSSPQIANGDQALWSEYAWYTLINISTLALFLLKKFRWEGWEGWMRFMW